MQRFSLAFVGFALLFPVAANASSLPCPYVWDTDLKVGSAGSDVLHLQQFLNAFLPSPIAVAGPGSPGNETSLFGSLTKKAVMTFQQKFAADILLPNALTAPTGMVGPATRKKLHLLCSGASSSTAMQSDATDNLIASLSDSATASVAPAGAGVLFFSMNLTAGSKDVVVHSVTMQRDGAGSDGAFASFGLYDEAGLQIGTIRTLNSNHELVFDHPFTIPAHSTHEFDMYASTNSDLTDYDGQAPAVEVTAISASSPVVGTFPLQGPMQTINNSLIVGVANLTLSPADPNVESRHYIDEKGVTFSAIRMTADSHEDLSISNIIWTQSGSAGSDDIANLATVIGTTTSPATQSPYASNEYVSFFDPAIVIPRGQTIDIAVRGDILPSAANRTIEFDILDNTDDISLTGLTYGFPVGAIPAGNTATAGHSVFLTTTGDTDGASLTPFFSGSIVDVSGGALNSISK
ncbi:MAG TPA: peptidoglycan-binding domain-containing protein [Candidatus Paceibacterota bacterium]|nr:peptidoglycan-binding domain-containing protein [Candidatus Paceibacterota bacterium]